MGKAKMNMSNKSEKRVFAAMSGGVDSSVAALLLKERGYDVIGVFMRCFNVDGCAEKDAEDARRVAEKLGIPFYVWDFEEEYKKRVVEYMVDGYRRGLTPNPDVMCNKEIKFGLFLEKALSLGGNYIATGHYVRLRRNSNHSNTLETHELQDKPIRDIRVSFELFESRDKNKDQSYFLWTLTQEQLKHCLFPLGDYLKSEVREIARNAGLPTAEKKDSQGICFLGKVTLQDFLKEYIPEQRGEVLSLAGERLGEHSGAQFYTIGQRHIGIGVRYPAFAKASAGRQVSGIRKNFEPVYVTEKNVDTNTVTVAEGNDNPALYKKEIELDKVHFIGEKHSHILKNVGMLKVLARVRYRQPLFPAVLTFSNSRELENKRHKNEPIVKLIFEKPQKFVAPGQSAVLYDKKRQMLGGGVIA